MAQAVLRQAHGAWRNRHSVSFVLCGASMTGAGRNSAVMTCWGSAGAATMAECAGCLGHCRHHRAGHRWSVGKARLNCAMFKLSDMVCGASVA
jgi:hypothetical protein